MTEPHRPSPSPRIEQALADLAEERRRLAEIQEEIGKTSTVRHSKDRILSVTVDGRGDVRKVAFDGTRYRRLSPAELAKLIVDTVNDARNEAIQKVGGMVNSDVLPGVSFADVAAGKADMDGIVRSFLGAALDRLPDHMRERAKNHLEGRL
jgi:DNA-binding protein YbaB